MALFLVQKIYMPSFAKLQSNPKLLSGLVGSMIWATNLIAAPLAVITLVLIYPITTLIFGDKWLVAIPLFYILWFSNLFVPTASVAMGLLDAMGESRTNFKYSLIWMSATWLLGIPAIYFAGLKGFVFSILTVQFTNLLLFRDAQKIVPFRIFYNVKQVWLIAFIAGITVGIAKYFYPITNIYQLIAYTFFGMAVYLGLISLMYYPRLVKIISAIALKVSK
jgi:O-antigen/teichoic acid export membrane protein